MRFFRSATPARPLVASAILAALVSAGLPSAAVFAQGAPGGDMPADDALPGVTIPPSPAPHQPLPPLPQRPQAKASPQAPAETPSSTQDRAQAQPPSEVPSPARRMEDLLAQLKRESDPEKAKNIAEQIQTGWNASGSATIDLLLQWASEAVEKKNNGAALDFLDRATLLDPDFTGAWQQRATLHYTMGDRRKAMADISEVLKREPRHFGAIAGMASILMENDQDALAQRALEQYLAIYPADREAREQLEKVSEKIAGSRT